MGTKKKSRSIAYSIIITFLLLAVGIVGGSSYMLHYSLIPSNNRGKDEVTSYKYMYANYPFIKSWMDSLRQVSALKDTFITNKAGIRLHAYYVAASHPTPKTAVIVHGYTDNAIRIMQIGYLYNHDLKYNILLPDLQYHGRSGGNAIQMGWKDRLDVMEWMDVANHLYGDSTKMIVHGISMGAATIMMVSGEKQPYYVKCFVEDCGYTSVWDEFLREIKEQFNLPAFPLLYTASALCSIKYGWNFKEASALNQIKKCHLPMLFIHGDKDAYVPTRMVYQLVKNKPGAKELWLVPDAIHAVSYKENPKAYTNRVRNFANKYLQ
ncbi:alpha/beta hydrolase [uncultured Bacteroides sp.]|uniref:alpha/beta hydrolase n=1 Tax=uncultured Bacteroides sp. TaxID=162156 RepID=UPI002AA8CFBF|nr:alpha/beta hydrolase [uncultured Bacteroides sp.]